MSDSNNPIMGHESIEFYIPLAARIYRIVYHSLLMFDTIAKIGKSRQCVSGC